MQLSDIQQSILDHLQEIDTWADINSIARLVDVHPNSVRNALRKLGANGYVERNLHRDGNKGRPLFIYRASKGDFPFFENINSCIENTSPEEKAFIEATLRGEYANSLEDSLHLEADIANLLRRLGAEVHIEKNIINISSRRFCELENTIPDIFGRILRFFVQEAIGSSGLVSVINASGNSHSRTVRLKITAL